MDSDSIYPPKLMFADEKGQYYMEYIPARLSSFETFIEKYTNKRRSKKRQTFYYWHYLSAIPVRNVKILDLNFILHVINDHDDSNPPDKEETKYFNKIYQKYQEETKYFNKIYQKYQKEVTFFLREKHKRGASINML